ncbi:paraquat-inducible protein A [Oricola sp.]|uniref:paraquat-inducible protein A n=1 Tax=Oricola sp. TaxID=1979950 RepID=UPI003BAD04CC
MRFFTSALLAASAFFFALGITQPLLRFERLVFFSETPSLIEIVAELWSSGDALLAAAVGLFSIVFPAFKILAAHALLAAESARPEAGARLRALLGIVSKWSMMDVLLVALVIFAAKTTGLADAFTQIGLWFYAGSVMTTAVATALLK